MTGKVSIESKSIEEQLEIIKERNDLALIKELALVKKPRAEKPKGNKKLTK